MPHLIKSSNWNLPVSISNSTLSMPRRSTVPCRLLNYLTPYFLERQKKPPSAHRFMLLEYHFSCGPSLIGAQTLELENCNGNREDPGLNPISRLILFQVSFHLFNMIANCEDHWFYPSHFNSLHKQLPRTLQIIGNITSIDDFFPLYLISLHVLCYIFPLQCKWSWTEIKAAARPPHYYISPHQLPCHDWAEVQQTNWPQHSRLVTHLPSLGTHGFGEQCPLLQTKP